MKGFIFSFQQVQFILKVVDLLEQAGFFFGRDQKVWGPFDFGNFRASFEQFHFPGIDLVGMKFVFLDQLTQGEQIFKDLKGYLSIEDLIKPTPSLNILNGLGNGK